VVKNSFSKAGGTGLIPGQRAKILPRSQKYQTLKKKNRRNIVIGSIKTLKKMIYIKKNLKLFF